MTRKPVSQWPEIIAALTQGDTLITASNRQAAFVHQRYRSEQTDKVWYRANILTYQTWLQQQFDQAHLELEQLQPNLLSKAQALYLWEQVIISTGDPLLNTALAARKAYKAAETLNLWRATDSLESDIDYQERLETRRFREWYRLIEARCQEDNLLMPYEKESRLITLLTSEKDIPDTNQHYLTLGFQQPNPIQLELFELFAKQGVEFNPIHFEQGECQLERLEFKDAISELKHCAVWAKQALEQNPNQRIAVIIPTLEQERNRVDYYFAKVFNPQAWQKAALEPQTVYDISLARQLSDYPLVNDLLMWLSLVQGTLKHEQLQQLIQTSYLKADWFTELRQPMLIALQKARKVDFNLNDLKHILRSELTSNFASACSEFDSILEQLGSIATEPLGPPGTWLDRLNHVLSIMDYAPSAELNSHEYQCRQALEGALESLASFDLLTHNLDWAGFLKLLRTTVYTTLFQPQTGDCPVQIMGLYEALSIEFDQIRMIGVDNTFWPAKASPNPFLPFRLQQQYEMPNASASRELLLCQQQFASLQQQSQRMVFSHVNDTSEPGHRLSPIIQEVSLTAHNLSLEINPLQHWLRAEAAQLRIKAQEDYFAPPIVASEIKGGSGILKDIAHCPFRAFAHLRLAAKMPDAPKDDLDAMDKGNLVHNILEILWQDHFQSDQRHLIEKLEEPAFEQQLDDLIHAQLNKLNHQQRKRFSVASLTLEHKRIKRLLLEWLSLETQREPFKVVETEQRHATVLGGALIHLVIDRVDVLTNGQRIIMDYKTGSVDIKHWFSERPEEPQLPLYACIQAEAGESIASICFARVKHQNCEFSGIAEQAGQLPGIKKAFNPEQFGSDARDINTQIPIWQRHLEDLMLEFVSGQASVAPKSDDSCRYCDLKPLCRIRHMNALPALEEFE